MGETSERLVALAHTGDRGAIGALVARCLPGVRRWAHGRVPRWMRAAVDTGDLVQDAVLATLSRLDAFQPQGRRALAVYLRTAVRHRLIDELRRARRWNAAPEGLDDMADAGPSPLHAAIDAETRRRYRAALACLPRRDQELLVGHFDLEYSHAQLGCMTGRSPHAARMALTRAIGRLAARMRD